MSAKTPTKTPKFTEITTSPVIIHRSPVVTSPQQNLTGAPRVARDIAADLYNNIQKWNDCHIRGAKLLQQIISIISDSIKHSLELENLVEDLYSVVQQLTIYVNTLGCLSTQMEALVKLQRNSEPVFISLTCQDLKNLLCDVTIAYKHEFKVKEYVLQNVAYSASKSEAMFYAACWAHQQNITDRVNLKLEVLLTETGHHKIC